MYWFGHVIAMILITMTTERFITICFPHQTKISLEKKKLIRIMLCLSLFCVCLDAHFWWTYSIYTFPKNNVQTTFPDFTVTQFTLVNSTDVDVNINNHTIETGSTKDFYQKCSYGDSKYKEFENKYWPWINVAFYAIIPFLSITTMNILLLARLMYSVYERKKNLGQNSSTFSIGSSSLLLISAGLLYLCCTGPIGIYHSYQHIWYVTLTHVDNPEQEAYRSLWRSILENMSYLTNALNLLVYCISGSMFRKELVLMFKCKTVESVMNSSRSKSMSSLNTAV